MENKKKMLVILFFIYLWLEIMYEGINNSSIS